MPGADSNEATSDSKHHRWLVVVLAVIVLAFFGFGFALVPLYNTFCKLTGFNGKTGGPVSAAVVAAQKVDSTRTLRVDFTSTIMPGLQWKVQPQQAEIQLHPGAITKTSFYVHNLGLTSSTAQAIMSVSPNAAARYLHKLECFCFHRETMKAGETRRMPLIFFISPGLPKDVRTVTLSYAFFPIKKRT